MPIRAPTRLMLTQERLFAFCGTGFLAVAAGISASSTAGELLLLGAKVIFNASIVFQIHNEIGYLIDIASLGRPN